MASEDVIHGEVGEAPGRRAGLAACVAPRPPPRSTVVTGGCATRSNLVGSPPPWTALAETRRHQGRRGFPPSDRALASLSLPSNLSLQHNPLLTDAVAPEFL